MPLDALLRATLFRRAFPFSFRFYFQLEETLKIEIQQVNIDDCINEETCDGNSCLSSLEIFDDEVYKVQTNLTTIIGKTLQFPCRKY